MERQRLILGGLLVALAICLIWAIVGSTTAARQRDRLEIERASRIELEQELDRISQENASLEKNLQEVKVLLGEEQANAQALKKALVDEQQITQALRSDLEKMTRLKEALEEDLKDALTSQGRVMPSPSKQEEELMKEEE